MLSGNVEAHLQNSDDSFPFDAILFTNCSLLQSVHQNRIDILRLFSTTRHSSKFIDFASLSNDRCDHTYRRRTCGCECKQKEIDTKLSFHIVDLFLYGKVGIAYADKGWKYYFLLRTLESVNSALNIANS